MTNFIDNYASYKQCLIQSTSISTQATNLSTMTTKQKLQTSQSQSLHNYTTLQSQIKQLNINQLSQQEQSKQPLSSYNFISMFGNIQQLKGKIMHAVDRTCLRNCIYTEMFNNNHICINNNNVNEQQTRKNKNNNYIQIYGIHQNFGNYLYFDLLCKINFMFQVHSITIYGTLLKNFIPYRIIGKDNRITISKFLLKVNAILKYGSFRIDPNSGQLVINLSNIFSQQQFIQILQQPYKLQNYLQQQLQKIKYFIILILPKILYLQNQLPLSYLNKINNTKLDQFDDFHTNNFKNNKNDNSNINSTTYTKITNYQRKLTKIISIMQMQCPFMFADHIYSGSKKITVQNIKKMNDIIKGAKIIKKNIHKDVIKVIGTIIGKYQLRNIQKGNEDDSINQADKKQFVSKLMQPLVRYPNGQIPSIYSQIQIINTNSNWQVIDQGGFGLISKSLTKFTFKPNSQRSSSSSQPQSQSPVSLSLIPLPQVNIFSRQLVKKQDSQQDIKKLPHQKAILSTLKNLTCPFIAKFYYSQQPAYKNSLLLQYCPNKSLSSLKFRNKQFLSLSTKLHYLKNIAQAIKFLKDNQINHLDIKPSNILISSGYAKLTDFGQSYHPSICPKNFRPGTSIPYAPPQVFSSSLINFNPKIDIFSYGILLYQLIFDSYPFDYSKLRYEIYKKSYAERDYKKFMYIVPQKLLQQSGRRMGNKCVIGILAYIAIRAMEDDQKKRPCIQWVLIVLDFCIGVLEDIMMPQA